MTHERVALVTGAARGIGAAAVHELCRRGYRVVAFDSCGDDRPAGVRYDLAGKEQLAALEAAHPGQVEAVVADVRDSAEVQRAVVLATDRFGRLDVAVTAAAVLVGGAPLWKTPRQHLETLWEIDVLGVWHVAAAAVPAMLTGPDPSGCRFVAIASAAGARGLFRLAAYTMAKHAVVGLVRGLAADLAGTGVTACAVSPGSTRTAMLAATAACYGTDVEDFAHAQLVGSLLEPDEIAASIAFAASVEGRVLNGSVVQADGGFRP